MLPLATKRLVAERKWSLLLIFVEVSLCSLWTGLLRSFQRVRALYYMTLNQLKNSRGPDFLFHLSAFFVFFNSLRTTRRLRRKKVKRVCVLIILSHCLVANASKAATRWHLKRIVQREALNQSQHESANHFFNLSSIAVKAVNVYIVDSGIHITHKEFNAGRAIYGYNARTPGSVPADCDGHGTHVAALAVGEYSGVATAARAVSVRILDCNGRGSCSNILDALEWILRDTSGKKTSGERSVVVMSIGSANIACAATVQATQVLWDRGVVVTAAAGNSNTDSCTLYPARNPGTIAVGATDIDDRIFKNNNKGDCIDILGPGVGIVSASGDGNDTSWRTRSGTSMAAPIVGGMAAIILGADSSLSASDVRSIIISSSTRNRIRASAGNEVMSGSVNRLAFAPWGRLFAEISMNRRTKLSLKDEHLYTSENQRFEVNDPSWNTSASFVALSMTLKPKTAPAMHFAATRIASAISLTAGIRITSILPRRASGASLFPNGSEPITIPMLFYFPMLPSLIGEYTQRLIVAGKNGAFDAEAKESISFAQGSLATALLINITVPQAELNESSSKDLDNERSEKRNNSISDGAKIAMITVGSFLVLAVVVAVVVFTIAPQIRNYKDKREAIREARQNETIVINPAASYPIGYTETVAVF